MANAEMEQDADFNIVNRRPLTRILKAIGLTTTARQPQLKFAPPQVSLNTTSKSAQQPAKQYAASKAMEQAPIAETLPLLNLA